MDDFEKWFLVYQMTINSLQKQKISAGKTRIAMLTDELSSAEKSKNEPLFLDIGKKIRSTENLMRRSTKIIEQINNTKFSELLSRLEKHSRFDGAVPDLKTGDLNLYSKSLKYGSLGLGRFRFVLNNKDHCFISVVALDYDVDGSSYQHWAVSGYTPCWGQWGEDVTKLTNEGDIYHLFDFLVIYLSTSPEQHTYMKIKDYKDRRVKLTKEQSEKKELAQFTVLKTKTTWIPRMTKTQIGSLPYSLQRIANYYESNDSFTDISTGIDNIDYNTLLANITGLPVY